MIKFIFVILFLSPYVIGMTVNASEAHLNKEEIMSNQHKALEAIKQSLGTEDGEYGIDLFISLHLAELPSSYWLQHLNIEIPSSEQVISLLTLREKWQDQEIYDFALPGNVTDYVISVSFDDEGNIENIAMES